MKLMSMIRKPVYTAALSGTILLGTSSVSLAQNFTDPTRANVLRQYYDNGLFAVDTTNDTWLDRPYANDGSAQIAFDSTFSTGTAQQTFALPTHLTVGSYRVQFEDSTRTPASFEIQGRLGNAAPWTTLKTLVAPP